MKFFSDIFQNYIYQIVSSKKNYLQNPFKGEITYSLDWWLFRVKGGAQTAFQDLFSTGKK